MTSYSRNSSLCRIEERDRLVAVGGVGAGQAEVERTRRPHRRAAYAELGSSILILGGRLRIDLVQDQLAVGAVGELLQELTHPHAVGVQLRNLRRGLLREEEVEIDRLLDVGKDVVRAGRGRIEVVLRQIQAPAAQRVLEQDGEADEQQGERERACRRRVSSVCHVP